jgi:hypothetical protein
MSREFEEIAKYLAQTGYQEGSDRLLELRASLHRDRKIPDFIYPRTPEEFKTAYDRYQTQIKTVIEKSFDPYISDIEKFCSDKGMDMRVYASETSLYPERNIQALPQGPDKHEDSDAIHWWITLSSSLDSDSASHKRGGPIDVKYSVQVGGQRERLFSVHGGSLKVISEAYVPALIWEQNELTDIQAVLDSAYNQGRSLNEDDLWPKYAFFLKDNGGLKEVYDRSDGFRLYRLPKKTQSQIREILNVERESNSSEDLDF